MDLRIRLVVYLSAFSGALLVVACWVMGAALQRDVAEEVEASAHLAELMLTVSEARSSGGADLAGLIADDRLRHVRVSLERSGMEQASPPEASSGALDGLARWLALRGPEMVQTVTAERRIALGDAILVIRPDPASEIREILRDTARVLATLAFFSVGTICAAWYAAHRALAPVRALEEGLAQLARGEEKAVLPQFELKEFRRIAQAIDRLAASLVESRAAERRLARRLMALQETERRELARELHDEFGQSLTAIGTAAAFVERHAGNAGAAALTECAHDIRGQAARMSDHVRGLLGQLRPHGLEGLGMVDALGELLDAWCQRAPGIVLEAHLPRALPPLSAAAGLALYRTLQEALTNALRHSGARRVSVRLEDAGDAAVLIIRDDGRGRAAEVLRKAGGGLLGMRERAEMAGGRFRLGDVPEGGLEIELRVPFDKTRET